MSDNLPGDKHNISVFPHPCLWTQLPMNFHSLELKLNGIKIPVNWYDRVNCESLLVRWPFISVQAKGDCWIQVLTVFVTFMNWTCYSRWLRASLTVVLTPKIVVVTNSDTCMLNERPIILVNLKILYYESNVRYWSHK